MEMRYFFILSILFWSSILSVSAHASFPDLPSTDPYYDSISVLQERGVVRGNQDGTLAPQNPLNRAELVVIVNRAAGVVALVSDKNCFPDVREEWFAGDVCAATRLGFLKGYPDGLYRPDRQVTVGEAAKIVTNTLTKSAYQDLNEALGWIEQQGFYLNKADINAPIKRNEAFERLYRILMYTEQSPDLLEQVDSQGNPFDPEIDPIKNHLGSHEPVYTEFDQHAYDYFLGRKPMILFFYASWCPYCRKSDETLMTAVSELKGGVIWFKVNFDTMNDLKKKYGITVQDTFVLVNASGEGVAKKTALKSAATAQEWMNQVLGQ